MQIVFLLNVYTTACSSPKIQFSSITIQLIPLSSSSSSFPLCSWYLHVWFICSFILVFFFWFCLLYSMYEWNHMELSFSIWLTLLSIKTLNFHPCCCTWQGFTFLCLSSIRLYVIYIIVCVYIHCIFSIHLLM